MIIEQAQKQAEIEKAEQGRFDEDSFDNQQNESLNLQDNEEIKIGGGGHSSALIKSEEKRPGEIAKHDSSELPRKHQQLPGFESQKSISGGGALGNNAKISKTKTKINLQDKKAFEELQNELIGEIKMLAEDQRASKIHAVKQLQKIKVEQMRRGTIGGGIHGQINQLGGKLENTLLGKISQTVKIQIQEQQAASKQSKSAPTPQTNAEVLQGAVPS